MHSSEPSAAPFDSRRFKLSIVSPCYNESAGIRHFHAELHKALDGIPSCDLEIVLVDDGSKDDTLKILEELAREDPSLRVLPLSRNFGHQIALTAGLDAASGDAVVMMDSDMQHPPTLIPEMVQRWLAGADIVSGMRQSMQGSARWKDSARGMFYGLINFLSDTYIVPGAADFCLLSRPAHQAVISVRERRRFLRGIVSWIGFNRTFIPFDEPPRFAGTPSYSVTKLIHLAMSAVFAFSTVPLRMATRLGLVLSAAGFGYLVYILLARLLFEQIAEGWTSTISVILILGGVQLVFLGVLGEYLAVVYEEVKQRPLYLLKQRPTEASPRASADSPSGQQAGDA